MAERNKPSGKVPHRRSVASRVRSGCTTCKTRHVKCDETKPVCNRCKQFSYACEGYGFGSGALRLPPGLGSTNNITPSAPRIPIPRVPNRRQASVDVRRSPNASTSGSSMCSSSSTSNAFSSTSSVSVEQEEKDQEVELKDSFIAALYPKLSPTSDEYIEKSLRFTMQRVLPNLLPNLASGAENPASHGWIRLAVENPAALQVRLYSTEIYHRLLFGRPLNPNSNLLAIYSECIRLLNKQMRDPLTACSDGNIIAVGGLRIMGQTKLAPKPVSLGALPSQGPLKELHGLNAYSQMTYDPLHRRGLDLLIKIRGGLQALKTHGIAAVTSYGDIVNATEELSAPRHIFVAISDAPIILDTEKTGGTTSTKSALPKLGNGFPLYWKQSASSSLRDLFTVLQSMAAYTIVVHDHCQGIRLQASKAKLADMRNLTQHRLLSLPPSEKLDTMSDPLYEPTRLAALAYSLLVVFPIHSSKAPFSELASQLRSNLSWLDLDGQQEPQLLLWIVMMGSIVSLNSANRPWFIAIVRKLAVRLMIETWTDMKSVLGSFLWLDITNDVDGKKIWDETGIIHT